MKNNLLALLCCFSALSLSAAQNRLQPQNQSQATPDAKSSQAAAPAAADDLKNVLAQLDKAASTFKSAKAKFQWDQYEKVVDETDVQTGEIYFRRAKDGMDAAVRVTSPDPKQVVFVDGTL